MKDKSTSSTGYEGMVRYMAKLQELLSISGFIITDNEYEYESLPSSLKVDMLQLVCPVGKEVSSANNLICGKALEQNI